MSVRTKPPNKRSGLESTSLCAVVRVTESRVETWKEVGEVVSVSAAGAGFTIKRKCRIGGLVSLTMPLPVHLRSHDRNKELYNVWGLVQHCHKVASDDGNRYQVGVAFVGKEPPPSF